ncbi:5-(carboxyamino)imidazole ribonucleotide synthase [Hymenobacter busanensis]|uniref:N5-carboxyaminoimidazole ribonucleotide synthase n=1 Tax=Hymenobacter busanensis TaxID=2607656 RepID=A0A7L4ZV10_9BACT|nr:5-(carboxyamino)imidazole ribonucleotide synthase [Hymenobacter busanensis]KAA9339210.1 5-(carboxyamino)imidazole ribonucleotide synthase [Hymenobacter busanensis]QHJ07028.1 5-(carboxyamino)imidazole ribonucleotide synthase [Hymenobacter busanensis]
MSEGTDIATTIPIFPGSVDTAGQRATLGVLGGGQLGRMFVHAAQRLGYFTAVLDPDAQSPAGLVSHHHIQTAYDDPAGLAQLAQLCQAITTEFENVPAQALQTLAQTRAVAPGAAVVGIAQNRIEEKAHFTACADISGVTCAPYTVIETPAQLQDVLANRADLLPGILKTARMGYDGKGQVRVKTVEELGAAWAELGGVACVLEKMLPLTAECSVLVARGWDGQVVSFAPQRNVHVDGILAVTHAYEGNMPPALATRSREAAVAIAQHLGYVGVLCVEFFVVDDGSAHGGLVVNEMAPRPHNSGHYTLDACDASQFDLQVHAMAGLPLPQPRQHSAAIMLNLLGEVWLDASGQRREPDWQAVLSLPGTHLHLYGKEHARIGRKMGHLTITGPDVDSVKTVARRAAGWLGLPGLNDI